MRFFGKGDEKEEAKPEARKDGASESQRLAAKAEQARKLEVKKGAPLKTFVLGLLPHEKLGGVGPERFEEGVRAALPKGTRIVRLATPDAALDASVAATRAAAEPGVRLFEIEGTLDVNETILLLQEKGLLEGQVDLALDRCVVLFRATGRLAGLTGAAESVDRFGFKYRDAVREPRGLRPVPAVGRPQALARRRRLSRGVSALAHDSLRGREDGALALGLAGEHGRRGGTAVGAPARQGRLARRVRARVRREVLLRFSFQGAEIKIMRFNLKILSNKLTNEFSTYRNLPLSLESLPKEVQDRLNRDPERYRALKEPGKFGQGFDLVRRAYEDLAGEYFQLDRVTTPASSSASGPLPRMPGHPTPAPTSTSTSTSSAATSGPQIAPAGSDSTEPAPEPVAASEAPEPVASDSRHGETTAARPATPASALPKPVSATIRGGVRKGDVGMALPLAPKTPKQPSESEPQRNGPSST